jgi:hypothetical protein
MASHQALALAGCEHASDAQCGSACRLYERNGYVAEQVIAFGPEAAQKEGIATDTIFEIVFFVKPICASVGQGAPHARATDAHLARSVDNRSAILRYSQQSWFVDCTWGESLKTICVKLCVPAVSAYRKSRLMRACFTAPQGLQCSSTEKLHTFFCLALKYHALGRQIAKLRFQVRACMRIKPSCHTVLANTCASRSTTTSRARWLEACLSDPSDVQPTSKRCARAGSAASCACVVTR